MRNVYSIFILIALFSCQKDISADESDRSPNNEAATDCFAFCDSLASYGKQFGFQTVVPRHDYDIVLSFSTSSDIALTLLCYYSCEGYITYDNTKTDTIDFEAGVPAKIVLSKLTANKRYSYQFHYRKKGSYQFVDSEIYSFTTPKGESESFSFAIIADSHLDENSDTLTYQRVLKNISQQNVDFILDLGDTFMTDKYGNNYTCAYGQYLAQRYYFGGICNNLPLFFVQGNHDGETGDKRAEMTAWAKKIRDNYFPVPSSQNYYSWEWGDALFIVLDPFTYTPSQGNGNPWQRTLGDTQYQWLESTIKDSTKRFKFVFIHNLVGGVDINGQARGGAEVAPLYEWGGHSADGSDLWSDMRPSWDMPIHELLKKYGVQIVFHGHDHVYAKQDYGGIIYQCLPQPSSKRYDHLTYATDYGYVNGNIYYVPGNIKVTISNHIKVEYITLNNTLQDEYELDN